MEGKGERDMAANQKSGRASSIPAGLGAGAGVSVLVTMLGTALLAKLLDAETIQWEAVGYGILIMVMLASMLGCITAMKKIKRKQGIVCLLSALTYWGILLSITALFFGGQYEAVGVTLLLIVGGSGCAFLLCARQERGGRNRKRKHTAARHPASIGRR